MRGWRVVVGLIVGLGLTVPVGAASAEGAGAVPTSVESGDADEPPSGLFVRNRVGLELAVAWFNEAWDFNHTHERVLEGVAGVWWTFAPRVSLIVETHAARVFQDTVRNAFVTGFAPIIRIQVLERHAGDLFFEIGPGFSWSDSVVPARGTRFNYLGIAGAGVAWPVAGGHHHLITGFRWFHVSNNGREGLDRNPDIQSLGGYVAFNVGF